VTAEEQFVAELEIFRTEVAGATQFLFAELAINELARRNDRVRRALNYEPLFWNTVTAGLQSAAFIAVGRIFDQGSPHNVDAVLRIAQQNRSIFSKDALAHRKRAASADADTWLPDYLKDVHVPTADDLRNLRTVVAKNRKLYEAQFRDMRHHFFAHKVAATPAEIAALSANAKVKDLQRLVVFLNQLQETLWQLLHNGRKPVLRPMPFSVKSLVRQRLNEWQHNSPQELTVIQTKSLIRRLTAGVRRRRASHARP
jgi:hypothetical protein